MNLRFNNFINVNNRGVYTKLIFLKLLINCLFVCFKNQLYIYIVIQIHS